MPELSLIDKSTATFKRLGRLVVELEALLGGLLWVWVLIFALYFGADLCTPYHCVSPCNLQSYMYISSALCAHVERGEISDASAVDGSRIPIRPTPNGD